MKQVLQSTYIRASLHCIIPVCLSQVTSNKSEISSPTSGLHLPDKVNSARFSKLRCIHVRKGQKAIESSYRAQVSRGHRKGLGVLQGYQLRAICGQSSSINDSKADLIVKNLFSNTTSLQRPTPRMLIIAAVGTGLFAAILGNFYIEGKRMDKKSL